MMPPIADDDDPLREEEWPDEADTEDGGDESLDLAACPACGKMIPEVAQCPYCRRWVSWESAAERRSRTIFWPLVIVGMILAILIVWHGLRF